MTWKPCCLQWNKFYRLNSYPQIILFLRILQQKISKKPGQLVKGGLPCAPALLSLTQPASKIAQIYSFWTMKTTTLKCFVRNCSLTWISCGGFLNVTADCKVPTSVLRKDISLSPFILTKIVREHAVLKQSFRYIVDIATVCRCHCL